MDLSGYLIILTACFFASIIGTMMGLAMLILPPILVFLGVPIHIAIGTSRFSMLGTVSGNIARFAKQGTMRREYILPFAIAGAIGSVSGAFFIEKIPERALEIVLGSFMILLSLIVLFESAIHKISKRKKKASLKQHALIVLCGLLVGGYIGVVGGGAATLVVFLLVAIYGLEFHEAIANQKAILLPMSILATIVFIYQGLVDFRIGIPMFLVNILGGATGAFLLSKIESKWLRRILSPILIALGIKLIVF